MSPVGYGIFMALGLILIIVSITSKKKAKAAQGWPTVPGVILSSRVEAHMERDTDGYNTTTYKPVVTYQYKVMGQEYTSSRIGFGSEAFSRKKCEEMIAGYPVGQPVNVHYDPDKPENATIETKAQGGTASLVVGILFLGAGLVMAGISYLGK